MNDRVRELFDVVSQDPTNREAAQELESLLSDAGEWTSLVDLYVHLAQSGAEEAVQAADWLRRAGEIAEQALADARRAVELYGASLEYDADGLLTLRRMRELLIGLEDWDGYVQVGEAEAERTTVPADQASLLYGMGEVLEEKAGDQERAMVCYQAAFRADQGCLQALFAARRIYRQHGHWEMVAQLLDLELQTVESAERQAEILQELGNLLLYDLDQAEMARAAFSRYVLLRPDDADVAGVLAELGGPVELEGESTRSEADAEPATEVLAPDAAPELAPAEAPQIVEADGGQAAVDLSVEAAPAPVAEPMVETAAETPAVAEAPAADAAPAVDVPSDVAALLESAREADGAERRSLLVRAVAAAAPAGGEALAALYAEAVKAAPGEPDLYEKVGRGLKIAPAVAQAIAAALDALASADFGGRGVALQAERVAFGAVHLDEGRTADYKLRELGKGGDALVQEWQLVRLIEGAKWRNIQQLLTDARGGDPNTARVEALRQMAQMAEERAGDVEKAADFWRQVHLADKSDHAARQALLRLYEAAGKWPQYAEILKLEVDDISERERDAKIAGVKRLVQVYKQHLNQDAMVVNLYGQILALDPTDQEAMAALVEKYEAMRRWPDLVTVLQKQAESAATASERIALNLRVAGLYLEKFRNQAEAIKAYEAVLGDEPANREAIEALQDMYEKRRDWEKLVAVQRQLADLESDPERRAARYKQIADNATQKIRRPDICLELWEQVLELSPRDVDALRALVGQYEQAKRWDELTSVIDRLVEVVTDRAEKIDLFQRAGIVLQERVGDRAGAVKAWQRLLELDPEHRRAGDSLKKALIELGDWTGLEEYFGARGKWDELVRTLEGQVGVQSDDDVRIDLLFRSATVWEKQLGQKDRALRALERILQIRPDHLEGARSLEPIYEENKDFRKLATVLEVVLQHETSPGERRALMLRSGRLNEEHLRNPDGAFEWIRRLVAEQPLDLEARAELERLGGLTRQWATVHDELRAALDRVGAMTVDDTDADLEAARLELLLSLARILDRELGAQEDALARYHEALAIDPESRVALDAVEALYTRLMAWPDLLGVLDRKLALATDVEERKALLRKQGLIHEEQLDDTESAIERYRSIVSEDEGDLDALQALHRLFDGGARHEELHDVLQQELALAAAGKGGDPLSIKMEIGHLALKHLGRPSEAIDAFREVVEADRDHAGARAALEALLDDAELRGTVSHILEPLYNEKSAWEPLVRVLEIQLEETGAAKQRFALLERIGKLHVDRTADVDRAFDAFARALREVPDSEPAVLQLTELAEVADKFADLARLLEEVVPDVRDDALGRGLLARLAGIYEERLGDVDMAVDAHRRVLDLDPDERASIEALDRLYLRSQQWPELLAVYRRKLEMTEATEDREALQFQIANLLEEMLDDAPEAITVYGDILEHDATNVRALRALDRLYGQQAMFAELADVLEKQLALSDDEHEKIALRVRLGNLHERELGNIGLAVEIHRTVIENDPDNAEAVEALERLLVEPDFQAAIADILEPIYKRRDDWQSLVRVYEIQRSHAADARRRVDLLHRMAELYQRRGGAPEQAFQCYARAFAEDPSDARTLASLHVIADALDLWRELVQVYERQVDDISDVAVATDVHKRVAKVLLEKVQDTGRARHHYEAAWRNDDADLDVCAALEDIYFQTEQWHELVAVLLRKSELVADPQAKKDLFFRVSAIYEEMLEDQERAVEIFRRVLEVDAVDARALDALERIFLALERWEDLMEVLHRKAELTDDVGARKDIYYVIGAAYERELDDLTRAVETYRRILEWDAADLTALQRLDGLYERLEHWEELLEVLRREAALVDDADERIALKFRIARLQEVHLEKVLDAIQGYEAILGQQPGHEPSLQALEGLIRTDREAALAASVLEPVLQKGAAWERLIAAWSDLLEVTTELETRTTLRLRSGQVHEDVLLDADAAFNAYADGFREDPTHADALAALERVAERAGAWQQLATLIEDQLVHISSEFVARDLYLRVARIYEEELTANVEAIERYRRVMEIDADHEGAILALDRLYQKEGMWVELADILQTEVSRAESVERVPLLLRLGTLYESALEDVPAAIDTYKEVLAAQPKQPDAIAALERLFEAGHEQPRIGEILEPLYLEREDWTRLHYVLEVLLGYLDGPEDRMKAMHRLAELALGKLKDRERGFDWYGRAFREVPDDARTRSELARLAVDTGRYADLVVVYREGLQNTQDVELLRSVSHEMATVYRQKLDDVAAAEQMYRYVLDIDPVDRDALQGLDELFEAQVRWEELVEILRREIDATYDEGEQLAYMFRLGRVYEGQLLELDQAVTQYRGILDREAHHRGALERLEQIYLTRQEWEPLFDVYGRQAESAEADGEKADLFARQANLAAELLNRPEDAIDLWNQVLDLKGEDAEALRALEQLYQQQERWRELVDVCERQVTLIQNDPARELELFARLGQVWGDHLDRERNALENWQKVLDRDPRHEGALWAVRELHERTGDLAALAEVDHRLLDLLEPNDGRRLDLYRQLGRLYQESLEKPADAIQAWTSVLTIEAYDAEAIDALEELYGATEDWRSCVEVLDRKVQITEDVFEKVTLLFRIAEMWEQKIGDADGAKGAYTRILELQSDNADASQQLERLYEADMQWEELVNLLLARLELSTDPFDRQELYARTARVFEERLGSADNAFVVLSQAMEETRDDERLGAELARLAEASGQWAQLIQLYENVLRVIGNAPESVALHLRVAQWYDEKLDQAENAGAHYQFALAIEPDNLAALAALESLLERYKKWPEVVAVLQRRADLSMEPDERKAALEKMAGILEDKLDRIPEAIEAWRQVLAIDDQDLATLRALERLYATAERWLDLVDALHRQALVIDDPNTIVENHLRIGELFETRLAAADRAIEAYRNALSIDDRCLDAMQALEKLYTAQDRWHELLDVYEMMLSVRTSKEDQLRIYSRIAMIQEEELGDADRTIETYRKMVLVDPGCVPAVRALDRLYREQERWDDLADVYLQHLEALQDTNAKIQVQSALAQLYRGPLRDAYRAIDALTPILDLDANHLPTLTALGELYAETEDWQSCIQALSREAHLLSDRREVIDRQFRVGQIYEEKIGDLDEAERWYRATLDHDPNFLPALESLARLYRQRAEWNEVVRVLKMMEAAHRAFPDKSKCLYEIGAVFDEYLGDRTTAIDYYEQAMDMSPDNALAAKPLVQVYLADQRWERAEPLLDLLLARAQGGDIRELQQLNHRLGFVAERLHKDDKALQHYRQAYELDSTHLPTLQGMADLLYRREDWDRAFKIYQTMLVHHRENLDEAAVVEIFFREGLIKLKVGERRKALDFFRKALDLDPKHPETLRAVVDLHEKNGDWEDVIHYRRQLLSVVADPIDRFQALVGIGDILREHLRHANKAVEAYNEALTLQPDSRLVLSKLLDLYEEARQWPNAVDVLTRLAEMESDPGRQSKYFYAVAVIQRDELKDNLTAVRTFDRALDADPAMLKAFQAIDQLLTKEKDWERQDRYYRKMLKRATERGLPDELVVTLAKNLGEINRTRLQKYEDAVKAYKIALAKRPEDLGVHGIVAELYELANDVDRAIMQHYRVIELNPRNIESYQHLRRLFMDSGRYDEAWCVCQVLSYLGHANADERAFFEKYRSRTLTQARKALDAQMWTLIYHPEMSLLLSRVFDLLFPYTAPLMALDHKDLKLHKRKDLVEPTEQTPFNNVLNYVSQVTRLPRFEVYRAQQGVNGIASANLNPPGMLVGMDVLGGRSLQELAFLTSKQLFSMSRSHFLATIDETYERRKQRLFTIVYTLTKLVNPGAEVPFMDEELLAGYQAIQPADRAEMAKLIAKMGEDPNQHLNLSKWLEMVEHSANRLGLLLANDLGAAVRSIKNETVQFSKAPVQDRVRELVLFALSDNYFKLRKALQLNIG